MLSYKDLTGYFGSSLSDKNFQEFLGRHFTDLTQYNISESDYIISEETEIEMGFTNNNGIYDEDDDILFSPGTPIFSHLNIYPGSTKLITALPFEIDFTHLRTDVVSKAGHPTRTNEGYSEALVKAFLVDNYDMGDIMINFDYDTEEQTINFIQIEDNKLKKY